MATQKSTNNPNFRHGFACDRKKRGEYSVWAGLKSRCKNPNNERWSRYGGRGITVCDRWMHSFQNFLADMGPRPSKKHQIDRIDNNGNYEPGNCRWATRKQQMRNTYRAKLLAFDGKLMGVAAWADELGVHKDILKMRLRRGWSIERTLSAPIGRWPSHSRPLATSRT